MVSAELLFRDKTAVPHRGSQYRGGQYRGGQFHSRPGLLRFDGPRRLGRSGVRIALLAALLAAVLAALAVVFGLFGLTLRDSVPAPTIPTIIVPSLVVPSLVVPTVVVVWRAPGQDEARMSAIDRGVWDSFIATRRRGQAGIRQTILDEARAEMTVSLAPVFDDMKARVGDYIGWFYFFPTTYRMAFTGVMAVLSRDAADGRSSEQVATEALNRLLQDRFLEVVVAPERYGPVVEAKARAVLGRAIEREQAVGVAEVAALAEFMLVHGRTTSGTAGGGKSPVALSWEALGIPAAAAAMSAPPDPVQLIKLDPALNLVQTTTATEGMMLVVRQLARRAVQVAANEAVQSMVMPMVAGGVLGPVEVFVPPLFGLAAFGIGIGAEFGAVKLRQGLEGARLTDLSLSVVDKLRENQSRLLSDAVSRRVENWLGDSAPAFTLSP